MRSSRPHCEQERLVHVFDGLGRLAHRDRERPEPDRAARERAAQRVEDRAVDLVEAELVDLEQRERVRAVVERDPAVGAHLGVVADALQQPVRDARRAAARDAISLAPSASSSTPRICATRDAGSS